MQSTYLKTQDANWVKGTAYPAAPTVYVTLHTADPALTGANAIAFNARFEVTGWTAVATASTNRETTITDIIQFINAPSSGSATHFGLWDAATSGNFLVGGLLNDVNGVPTPIAYTSGGDVTIPANSLKVAIVRGAFSDYFIDAKLNWLRGTTFPTAPTTTYLGLGSNLLSDGTGTELITRQAITWGTNTATAANMIRILNTAQISTTAPSAITTNSAAVYTASSGGNLLWVDSLSSRAFASGEAIVFEVNRILVDF